MAISRKTDPATSRAGAQTINRARPKLIDAVARYVRLNCVGEAEKATAAEIAAALAVKDFELYGVERCQTESYRKRVREAARKNLIRESEEKKICSVTGQEATAFFFGLGAA